MGFKMTFGVAFVLAFFTGAVACVEEERTSSLEEEPEATEETGFGF